MKNSNIFKSHKQFFISLKLFLLIKKNIKKKNTIDKLVIIVYEKFSENSNPAIPSLGLLKTRKKPGKEKKIQNMINFKKFFFLSFL